MLKVFNAFQMVTLFAAMPHIIGWLKTEPFTYSTGAFWAAIAVYVVMFLMGIGVAMNSMDEKNWWW